MLLRANEFARRDSGNVQCRADALRLSWVVTDLPGADSHALDVRLSCSARIADSDADRKMFAEVFLNNRHAVTTDDLIEHFSRTVKSTLTSLASQCKAADVVGGTSTVGGVAQHAAWIAALAKSTNAIAFACGVELLAPFQLDVESPSLQRAKLEQIARQQAEQRTAGQLQHLQRAGELLKQFQELRQNSPDLPAGRLLEQMPPADRGLALQSLLLASSNEAATATLWAVAGPSLAKIDPRAKPGRIELLEIPTTLGPLRSVQPASLEGRRVLLIGARSGVMVVAPEELSAVQLYHHPSLDSQLGFNRVICTSTDIWATHSDAGLVGWKLRQTAQPHTVLADRVTVPRPQLPTLSSGSLIGSSSQTQTAGPRHLQRLDDHRLIYSVAHEVVIRDGEQRIALPAQSQAEVIAILPAPRAVVAVHQDGTLVIIDRQSRQVSDVRRRGSRLSTAGVMPWLGDVRLLLANDQGPIDCLGLDDPLVSEFLSPYRGLKILTATAGLIAAVSPDRQRIVVWQSYDGTRPVGEIHVSTQTRHRVADVEFEG
jgi:hypothetical protein